MMPFQGVCKIYLVANNLKVGLQIASEKKFESLAFSDIWERDLGMRIIEKKTILKGSSDHSSTLSYVLCNNSIKLYTTHIS